MIQVLLQSLSLPMFIVFAFVVYWGAAMFSFTIWMHGLAPRKNFFFLFPCLIVDVMIIPAAVLDLATGVITLITGTAVSYFYLWKADP